MKIFLLIFLFPLVHCTEIITFVIFTQENEYFFNKSKELEDDISEQAKNVKLQKYNTVVVSNKFYDEGEWTIIPVLTKLKRKYLNSSWFVFLEDRTGINLKILLKVLQKYDSKKKIWIGKSLYDKEPTIIHHFAFDDDKFLYPHTGSGFAMTFPLLNSTVENLSKIENDFHIDKAYELALLVWDNSNGTKLTEDEAFCNKRGDKCATFIKTFKSCGPRVPLNSVYFAVKTCEKFHQNRVNVVQSTWGRHAQVKFFSDTKDDSIPTVSLGIPNTEEGHCEKSIAIIKYVNQLDDNIKWVMLADDDTILSVARLLDFLTCFNPNDVIVMGERYGYNLQHEYGINYITGGGGVVFSRKAIKILADTCRCPSLNTPDDMYLGHCVAKLGYRVIHSPLFHQARPNDYSPDFLALEPHISFHKHWISDPIQIYNNWFSKDDSTIDKHIHTEL